MLSHIVGSLGGALPLQSCAALHTAIQHVGISSFAAIHDDMTGPRLSDAFPKELVNNIYVHAGKKQTGVSLRYILDFGVHPLERQMLLSSKFLLNELPVRLAHRVVDLENLPSGLSSKPQVLRVRDYYAVSFQELSAFPPIKDMNDVMLFTDLLKRIFRRHGNVVPMMAKGVESFKHDLAMSGTPLDEVPEIHQFLDTFFLSRIGIRFLIGHHISLQEKSRQDHIGLIHTRCSPWQVAQDAVNDAKSICYREYGGAPHVLLHSTPNLTFPYVPSHLHHMLFELLKNSLRAVQETWEDADEEPPPVSVVIAEGGEDITIKVSDQGGGIPRSGLPKIWTYLFTTAKSPLPDVPDDDVMHSMPAVLAGYGCGLPISRLYARYFGGDMQIISMDGYGTDAYLHLNKLGNGEEPLP